MATSGEAQSQLPLLLPALAEVGSGSLRVAFSWSTIEPQPGQWDFSAPDRMVRLMRFHKVRPTAILLTSPPWARTLDAPADGTTNGMTLPISHIEAWSKFVARVIARYHHDVHYWEVWNEPNARAFNQGNHSPSDYAQLAQRACRAAKQVTPDTRVGIGSANFDLRYLRLVISAMEAPPCFDFISVHPYELLGGLRLAGGEAQFLDIVPNLRAMLQEVAPEKASVPLWFSELGYSAAASPLDAGQQGRASLDEDGGAEERVAELLIKAYTLAHVQGVQHVQWFEVKDAGGSQDHGLLDDSGRRRRAFHAYQKLSSALGPQARYLGWTQLGENKAGVGFLFRPAHGRFDILVAWTLDGGKARWIPPRTAKTLFAVEKLPHSEYMLSASPAVLQLMRGEFAETARVRHGAPFPPRPRTSRASTARLKLGNSYRAAGLRLLNRNRTTEHTFEDGTSGAKLLSGNHFLFAADSPFAGYHRRSFCVDIKARALAPYTKGEYAGMNLFYQPHGGHATTAPAYPYKNLGQWYALPDDDRWHEWSFCVGDAMLVHTFGYGFSLSVDASVPFALGEVTLRFPPNGGSMTR